MVGKFWEGKWEYERITYFVGYPRVERSLARSNRASLSDVSLSSEVQVYKSIVIYSSYDRLVHDQYYIISRGNNPTSLVLTLAHAKS